MYQTTGLEGLALLKGIGIGMWIFFIIVYIYAAYCFQRIAGKTGTPNGWMAWIPILQFYLYCKIGRKPGWWLILWLVPFVNIIIMLLTYLGMAKAMKKPTWQGVLLWLWPISLVIIGLWAFGKE